MTSKGTDATPDLVQKIEMLTGAMLIEIYIKVLLFNIGFRVRGQSIRADIGLFCLI